MHKTTIHLIFLGVLFFSILTHAQLPEGRNLGGEEWIDSYNVNGLCWCDSTFEQDLGEKNKVYFTINNLKIDIKDVCDELQYHPMVRDYAAGDPIYNDIQCDSGAENIAIDETECSGIQLQLDIEWLESRDRFRKEVKALNCNSYDSLTKIEAENFCSQLGIKTEINSEGNNVGHINNGDWLKFKNVDLTGAQSIDGRVATSNSGGDIEVRLGSSKGALLGTLTITNTGGDQLYKTISTNLSSVSGVQDVYLVFKGENGYLFNLDWVEFLSVSKSSKDVLSVNGPEINVYPNPVVNSIFIENASGGTLRAYDISGELVLLNDITTNKEEFNVEELIAGVYYFQINCNKKLSTLKIIK